MAGLNVSSCSSDFLQKGEVHSGIRSKMDLINHVFKSSQQEVSKTLSGLINYVLDKFILAVTSRVSLSSLQL